MGKRIHDAVAHAARRAASFASCQAVDIWSQASLPAKKASAVSW
jgi:hypothetical protein